MDKRQAEEIIFKTVKKSTAEHCEVSLGGSTRGNIRFARNTVSTSGIENNASLAVSVAFGKKTGTATTNDLSDESLTRAVEKAEEMALLSPESPEYMEPLGPQDYVESKTFVPSILDLTPQKRAEMVKKCLDYITAKKGFVGAGFLENRDGFSAIGNSKGLFAYNRASQVNFTLTVRTEDGTGSGWVNREANDIKALDIQEVSEIALNKAAMSSGAKAIEPGKYTVILEPAAASGLLNRMFYGLSARSADEGRSFLSKEDGGTRLGEKLLDERITVTSDPLHPEVPSSTWSQSGLPVTPNIWIQDGVIKNLYYSRYWAKEKGVEPVPFPGNIIMEGGSQSVQELIKNTERGILVTRFWYIRSVDPQTLLYTGLTRDGTFFIENGAIAYPIKNMRFNESPVIMLNNLEAMGRPERVNGNLIPPIKVRDFTFTSLSDAI